MPANTSKGITYPTTGDSVSNLHGVFSTMASSIDTTLGGYIPTSDRATVSDINVGTSATKVVTVKSLTDAGFQPGDTGWVDIYSNTFTGAGFSKGSGATMRVRKVGNLVQIEVRGIVKDKDAPLAIPVTGDVTNRGILGGIPSAYRPARMVALTSMDLGRANAYVLGTDGAIDIVAMVPASNQSGTVNCPTGERFSCGGMYFV